MPPVFYGRVWEISLVCLAFIIHSAKWMCVFNCAVEETKKMGVRAKGHNDKAVWPRVNLIRREARHAGEPEELAQRNRGDFN